MLMMLSCGKSSERFEPLPSVPADSIVPTLQSLVSLDSNEVRFDQILPDTIMTKAGKLMAITDELFVNVKGQVFNSGTDPLYCNKLILNIKESKKLGELFLSGFSSALSTDTFISFMDAVKLQLNCDLATLYINAGKKFPLFFPSSILSDSLQLYYPNQVITSEFITFETTSQSPFAVYSHWLNTEQDLVSGYESIAQRLGWITLSKKYTVKENSAAITINLGQGYDGFNTKIWVVDTQNRLILPVPFSATNSFQFKGLPSGQPVKIVAIATDSGHDWYFNATDAFINDNSFNLTLENSSLQAIREAVLKW